MRTNIKQGETVLVLCIAAALMALGIGGLSAFLTQGEAANTTTAYAEAVDVDSSAPSSEVSAPAGLNVKVDMRGNELPSDVVSAQYAVAMAADIAERTFGAHATDRAFVVLLDSATSFSKGDFGAYAWQVYLQTDQGALHVIVNASTGVDVRGDLSSDEMDWTWFDEWDEITAEQQRLAEEQKMQEIRNDPEAYGYAASEPLTDEQLGAIADKKREGMFAFAATMTEYPQGQKAVDYVNAQGIGNGANAVSGHILMEGSSLGALTYTVEVALDDGSYLFVRMAQDANPTTRDYAFLGYERSTIDYATYAYGH